MEKFHVTTQLTNNTENKKNNIELEQSIRARLRPDDSESSDDNDINLIIDQESKAEVDYSLSGPNVSISEPDVSISGQTTTITVEVPNVKQIASDINKVGNAAIYKSSQSITDIGQTTVAGTKQAVGSAITGTKQAVGSAITGTKQAVGSAITGTKQVVGAAITGITGIRQALIPTVIQNDLKYATTALSTIPTNVISNIHQSPLTLNEILQSLNPLPYLETNETLCFYKKNLMKAAFILFTILLVVLVFKGSDVNTTL
jgi:hypothetical protein